MKASRRAKSKRAFSLCETIAAVAAMLIAQPCAADTLTPIYRFTGGADGGNPSGVVVGNDDALYIATGTSIDRAVLKTNGRWRVTPIVSTPFPVQSLVPFGRSLFGVTASGGTDCEGLGFECGAVVEIAPVAGAWTVNTIYAFKGGNDGVRPVGIAVDANGVIYGLTHEGGGSNACGSNTGVPTGCGTLFMLQKRNGAWKEKVLHAFSGADGQFPLTAPSLDSAGNLFWTTNLGGSASFARRGIHPDGGAGVGNVGGCALPGTEGDRGCSDLFSFSLSGDGGYPISTPMPLAPSGRTESIIGTATEGGRTNLCANIGDEGCGTVFMLTGRPGGSKTWRYTLIHKFTPQDGAVPHDALTALDADALYGVTRSDGKQRPACGSLGCGSIYKLDNSGGGWSWGGVVWQFTGGVHDGYQPQSPLALYHGMIIGTTRFGGLSGSACVPSDSGCGVLFALSP